MSDQSQKTGRTSELKQAALLIRHGVRAPLAKEIKYLTPFTNLPWPKWDAEPGQLTPRACRLIQYLGAWYGEHYRGLLGCEEKPPSQWMHIRADSMQRCVDTADNWLTGFFQGKKPDVQVHHQEILDPPEVDPLFLPVNAKMVEPTGAGDAVRGRICDDLEGAIQSLRRPLNLVQKVLGGPVFSPELYGMKNEILATGHVRGTLSIAVYTSDILVMQHAEGWPMEKVGWGRINREELLEIERARVFTDHLVERAPMIARAQASNLLTHILAGMDRAVTGKAIPALPFSPDVRLVGYFGHDINIQTMGGLLNISWMPGGSVQNQAPPACAQVFELHRDLDSGEHFVRLWFVTATLDQMVHGTPLSKDNPPSMGPIGLNYSRELKTSLDIPYEAFSRIAREAIDPAGVIGELSGWIQET